MIEAFLYFIPVLVGYREYMDWHKQALYAEVVKLEALKDNRQSKTIESNMSLVIELKLMIDSINQLVTAIEEARQ